MRKIAFIFASRERPKKFYDCLNNIRSTCDRRNYFVWAKLDTDDPTIEEYKSKLSEYPELTVKWGLSKGKIHAINRDLEDMPDFDVLINHSDDFWINGVGFDTVILDKCGLDEYLHIPDGHVNERLCTYSIMGREYFLLDKYIYHPDFISVYADNLQQDLAKKRGRYKYLNQQMVEHRHFAWGRGEKDALLERTEDKKIYAIDHQTYIRLKAELI